MTDVVLSLMDIVEDMHRAIPFRSFHQDAGTSEGEAASGLVYRAIRGTARLSGAGASAVLGLLAHRKKAVETSPQREALIAAINGVFGDRLHDKGNALATPMQLFTSGTLVDTEGPSLQQSLSAASRKILVLVHGLCMNDMQWTRQGHDHGAALRRDLGYVPLYLHYNSGRRIAENGREFSARLERLLHASPYKG